mmetsp:Transcript_22910/g.47798  ORF Transcript_22910/g.47798 Transcript_22910/m.47798 type:complete len:292 (-) Transcript_22910:129-1004(-)
MLLLLNNFPVNVCMVAFTTFSKYSATSLGLYRRCCFNTSLVDEIIQPILTGSSLSIKLFGISSEENQFCCFSFGINNGAKGIIERQSTDLDSVHSNKLVSFLQYSVLSCNSIFLKRLNKDTSIIRVVFFKHNSHGLGQFDGDVVSLVHGINKVDVGKGSSLFGLVIIRNDTPSHPSINGSFAFRINLRSLQCRSTEGIFHSIKETHVQNGVRSFMGLGRNSKASRSSNGSGSGQNSHGIHLCRLFGYLDFVLFCGLLDKGRHESTTRTESIKVVVIFECQHSAGDTTYEFV